jgi:hypothetical protein
VGTVTDTTALTTLIDQPGLTRRLGDNAAIWFRAEFSGGAPAALAPLFQTLMGNGE